MIWLELLLPAVISACSSLCVSKCEVYFQAVKCQEICGCASTPLSDMTVSPAISLLAANDPYPFLVSPEAKALEYCQGSCGSFCTVLHARANQDCNSLCSALFCVNPAAMPQVYLLDRTEEQQREEYKQIVVWGLGLVLASAAIVTCTLKVCEDRQKRYRLMHRS